LSCHIYEIKSGLEIIIILIRMSKKKRIKVLYVIDTLYPAGAERSLLEITKRFKQTEPVFVHIYPTDTLKTEFLARGLKVYSLNVEGEWNLKEAEEKLAGIYKLEKPDIIHSTLFRSDVITRRLKRKFPKIPLISSYVNNSYHSKRFNQENLMGKLKLKFIQFWDTYTSRNVDYFISNSETIKLTKSKDTNVALDKIEVIYRGRDVKSFQAIKEMGKLSNLKDGLGLHGKKIILNVSRLIERKGQKDLIKAMPEVLIQNPDTILIIAGEGDYMEELNATIAKLNLDNNVKLLGRRNDIPELLEIADVFAFPSYFEGLPGALIEAMLSNILIVCSDIPENMECVNTDSALIFKVGNIEDISEKLITGLKTDINYKSKIKEAKVQAQYKFDIHRISEKYEKYYETILVN
jgi:glycosyltransferase involved in cell wall biosynthesis